MKASQHCEPSEQWLALIRECGGEEQARDALLRDREQLQALLRAVRGCGLNPELLLL